MRISMPVSSDTAEHARAQAVSLLQSMGYRTVTAVRVEASDPPDVSDAFAMSSGMRNFTVVAEATRR